MNEKPILFNTEMVRAILDGRKTQTRRPIKHLPLEEPYATVDENGLWISDENGDWYRAEAFFPLKSGDILWVREAWNKCECSENYCYRANFNFDTLFKWKPSIHMPKEAARLFLIVKDVHAERLQDITLEDCHKEGIDKSNIRHEISGEVKVDFSQEAFITLWDSTIKKANLPKYGWDANPWVWVIEFEVVKPESKRNGTGQDEGCSADGGLMPAT